MRSGRSQQSLQRLGIRCTAFLLLVQLVAAQLPIPIATQLRIPLNSKNNPQRKDLSQRFPCENRPCGCQSAAECKKSCCCFNTQQKLVWAEKNAISPSEVVSVTPFESKAAVKKKTCCIQHQQSQTCEVAPKKSAKPQRTLLSRMKLVMGIAAQECRGIHQSLSGQLVFVVPTAFPIMPQFDQICERLLHCADRPSVAVIEPPVPPPRLQFAS